MCGVLEYCLADVIELAVEAARSSKKGRIEPRHIMLAIRNDEELNQLCRYVTIPHSGVLPNMHQALFPLPKYKENGTKPKRSTK